MKSIEEPDLESDIATGISCKNKNEQNMHFSSELQLSDYTQLLQIAEREREYRIESSPQTRRERRSLIRMIYRHS